MWMNTTLMAESKEELKSFLMRVKEESERASSRINIFLKKKLRLWHLAPFTAWQIEGEKVEVVTDFLLGSKTVADGDCSCEIRR